jgi:MoaA/NifB/PqqE/SkfB family radical SAM enzyme
MEIKDACDYLAEATSVSKLQSFMVFGGEPMLFPDRVIAMFKEANRLRIPRIEIITNGVWGKHRKTAEKSAEELKTAGLNDANVSVDAFHVQHTPIDYPRNAALALLRAGVKDVRWNVAVAESIDAENEYDKRTKQILEELEPVGIKAGFVKIMPVGRAVKSLQEFFPPEPLYGACQGEPIIGNNLTSPESICIRPSGWVDICWNLPIGNAKKTPLGRIINEYDWRNDRMISTLAKEGPAGLLEFPEAKHFQLQKNQYINKCHLCIEIRRALKSA